MFVVVSELPTEDIKEGKIYCIRDTSSTAQDNNYIEYAYINNKWEKVGEFQPEPDLSGYAKLTGANFTGKVMVAADLTARRFALIGDLVNAHGVYLPGANSNRIESEVYNTKGTLSNIGTSEDFVFTLEDGTKVTKSIRVVSTTNG